jgi:hypothetical protein
MSNIETVVETTRKVSKVADHYLLDSAGNVVEEEENAVGYRYKMVGTDEAFDWSWEEANELERKMLAIFGAKTLATNVTSGARQSKGALPPDQIAAVKNRFASIRDGEWTDRERGEGGFAIDKQKMAQAVANARVAMQKPADTVENYLRRFEEEAGYLAKCRKVPQVNAEYAKLAGRAQVTIDDI